MLAIVSGCHCSQGNPIGMMAESTSSMRCRRRCDGEVEVLSWQPPEVPGQYLYWLVAFQPLLVEGKELPMNAVDILKYGQQTVLQTLAEFPEAAVEKSGACGAWSVKDIIAHLASYEEV